MNRGATMLVLVFLLIGTPASFADGLRNVKVGDVIGEFSLRTIGGEEFRSQDQRGRTMVLVYVAAEQTSSEKAMQAAAAIASELRDQELQFLFVTADVTRVAFFRQQRDRLRLHGIPLALDVQRKLYGGLGLIVLPTTIIVDGQGRLRHVIASRKSDYEHVLRTQARHALGLIDDATRDGLLNARAFERSRPEDLIARHRAAAGLLRRSGLDADAERELRQALEIDPDHAGTLLDLADLQIKRTQLDEAETLVARVLTRHPEHRRAKLARGIVLFHRGRLDEAERVLQEVLLLNPDPIRTHYYLGLLKEQRGDAAGAIVHFKEALSRLLEDHS